MGGVGMLSSGWVGGVGGFVAEWVGMEDGCLGRVADVDGLLNGWVCGCVSREGGWIAEWVGRWVCVWGGWVGC